MLDRRVALRLRVVERHDALLEAQCFRLIRKKAKLVKAHANKAGLVETHDAPAAEMRRVDDGGVPGVVRKKFQHVLVPAELGAELGLLEENAVRRRVHGVYVGVSEGMPQRDG